MKTMGVIVFLVALAACTSEPPPMRPAEPPSPATAASRFVTVKQPGDRSILESPAIVRASPAASGEVTAPAPLRIARVHVRAGDAVSAGDPIVDTYAPAVLDAAAVFLSSASRARAHEQRADQLEALLGEGLVRRAEVFERRAMAAELRADRLRAIAILRSSGVDPEDAANLLERGVVTLVAPVDGIVMELSARVGRSYEPGAAPIARIMGEASARVEVRSAKRWPAASSVVFTTSDGRRVALNPTPVASVVVPADGTIRSWFEPQEALSFPDGLVGTATISAANDVWEVPITSIGQGGGKSRLVRQRGETTEQIEVEVAAASGASALVRGPLEPGDRVASEFPRDEAGRSGQ